MDARIDAKKKKRVAKGLGVTQGMVKGEQKTKEWGKKAGELWILLKLVEDVEEKKRRSRGWSGSAGHEWRELEGRLRPDLG